MCTLARDTDIYCYLVRLSLRQTLSLPVSVCVCVWPGVGLVWLPVTVLGCCLHTNNELFLKNNLFGKVMTQIQTCGSSYFIEKKRKRIIPNRRNVSVPEICFLDTFLTTSLSP